MNKSEKNYLSFNGNVQSYFWTGFFFFLFLPIKTNIAVLEIRFVRLILHLI